MADVLDKQTIKALSADARQEIMKLLAKRPHTASELAKITRKHVTTVSEHLDVLEASGLVRKKDSGNKWVYYTLTDKGEHLFKPQFYSWVVVFSLSVVFMFVGFLRLVNYNSTGYARDLGASSPMTEKAAESIQNIQSAPVAAVDYIAYALIALGIAGIAYLLYRKWLFNAKSKL